MSRYQLHEEIGRGAMGVVYRATQLDLDRVVALKLLGLDGLEDRSAVARFHTEAQALAGFDHPHIVRVLDTGTHDGRPFMAMELLEGVDLQTLRDRQGAQPVEPVLSWLVQLCDALAAIHARGIVHRDVKPTNIFVSPGGHVTLMDFGLVRTGNAPRLTEPGTVVGTPRYLAPEAVVGDPPAAPLDVFALALTVHEMLIGRPWTPIQDAEQVMHRIVSGPLPDLAREVPAAPEWLAQAQAAALEPDPGKRISAARYLDILRRNGVRASLPPAPVAPLASVTALKASASLAPPGYRIIAEIGAGAMGVVFRAEQLALRREVALKVMRPGLGTSGQFRERFQREALAMSKVSHPSLIKVFDVGVAGDQPYIAMELVPGRTLEAAIVAAPVDVRRRGDAIFEPMVEALAVMHKQGLAHRDLKPGNVMVTPDWKPVVMDLGLVKDVAGDGTVLTRTGALLGTPAFLAPEVLAGGEASARADVWALGCIYFYLFAGRPPFDSESLMGLYKAITEVQLPDLDAAVVDMPPDARAFMLRLLSKDLARRPADAAAVLRELRAMKGGARRKSGNISRPLVSMVAPPPPPRRGRAIAVALAVAAGAALFSARREPSRDPHPVTSATPVMVTPRWRDLDGALRAFGAPQRHAELCAALERRRSRMRELRAVEAALRGEWRGRVQTLLAETRLKEWIAEARNDPSLAQTDDTMRRYRLVEDIAFFFAQLSDLGVDVGVDLGPLYPPLHRPFQLFPDLPEDNWTPADRKKAGDYTSALAALVDGGETIGLRYTLGYGFVPTLPVENKIAYREGNAIHLWSAKDGAISSQDIPELGLVAEHLSYRCKAKLPLRQVRQGERLLFEINCNGLGPTERLSFHFSRDGTSFSSSVFTITGQNDNTVRAYHHWIDPALVSEPVWLRVDYHHCESIKVTGSASFLWALFHYVKAPAR